MKFFVDTAEIDAIAELNDLGMVDGVTTNPSLIKKSGRDILEVTTPKGVVLLPFSRAAVPTVDVAGGRVIADPPEGIFPDD